MMTMMRFRAYNLCLGACFLLVLLGLFTHRIPGQEKPKFATSAKIDPFDPAIDKIDIRNIPNFSTVAVNECSEVITTDVAGKPVELRFQPQFRRVAEKAAIMLERSVRRTIELLSPLDATGVEIYLLQRDEVPRSYRMTRPYREGVYMNLYLFSKEEDLDLDCTGSEESLCSEIYSTIPHEIAHEPFGKLVKRKNTRWFEEGLADYIKHEVTAEFAPSLNTKPQPSIHPGIEDPDVRRAVFDWNEMRFSDLKAGSKIKWQAQGAIYLLAEGLFDRAFEISKKRGVKDPLGVLLRELNTFVQKKGKPASRKDVFNIIRQHLRVDIQTLQPV